MATNGRFGKGCQIAGAIAAVIGMLALGFLSYGRMGERVTHVEKEVDGVCDTTEDHGKAITSIEATQKSVIERFDRFEVQQMSRFDRLETIILDAK